MGRLNIYIHPAEVNMFPSASHPLPTTPSKASFPPLRRGKGVTYVSGTMCHLCLRPLINHLAKSTRKSSPLILHLESYWTARGHLAVTAVALSPVPNTTSISFANVRNAIPSAGTRRFRFRTFTASEREPSPRSLHSAIAVHRTTRLLARARSLSRESSILAFP